MRRSLDPVVFPQPTASPRGSSLRVGVLGGPWDTGRKARDGAVLGFEDVNVALSRGAAEGRFRLVVEDFTLFTDYDRMRAFMAGCDTVYANCGPWAALLHLVRHRERLATRIIREVRTVGWIGYIWQEEVVRQLVAPGDQVVYPSHYCRDTWADRAAGCGDSLVYYPLASDALRPAAAPARSTGTVGFFSALSEDKGFGYLAPTVERMMAGGHRIHQVVLAGERADPELFDRVAADLATLGVALRYEGMLSNAAVRQVMRRCDLVFFLSVSSIESLGRIIVEAWEQGIPVVTADFGAAPDLVADAYRIPVDIEGTVTGPSDRAFAVGRLDVDRWAPPRELDAGDCFLPAVAHYRPAAEALDSPPPVPRIPPQPARRPLDFSYTCNADASALAADLLAAPHRLDGTGLPDLVDLGGSLKRYLLDRGFNPTVHFARSVHPQAETA